MSTIKDVAQRAGVAPSTVSKYLNGGCVRSENSDAIRKAIVAEAAEIGAQLRA